SRRSLLGLMLATPIAAACSAPSTQGGSGNGESSSGNSGSGKNTESDVPNAGVIVLALDDQPSTLDPAGASNKDIGLNFAFNLYERLVDLPADSNTLVPV